MNFHPPALRGLGAQPAWPPRWKSSYAAAFLATTVFLVRWIEDPALARRFGQQFEDYRNQVPGWWPRLPRRSP
jgi:protein-S-isoprenylcysteine O-methyltransferase Ste14